MKELRDYVAEIPDFPKEGIIFRDVTTILSDADGLHMAVDGLIDMMKDIDFDLVVGSESRGFIFGAPVAYAMHKGFILVRKKGKLPRETISETYDLEYGSATLEMHKDAIKPGQKVVIIDDLIATGGTTEAIVKMVEREGGDIVKIGFVMELAGLKGREKLSKYDVDSLIIYEGN
ncbi:MAG: adenine phosphoribosyltransferase [Candidatus Methanoprimaticola hominis]|nr:MAG: adenine phosphoribosyltransferase [Methanomassiliicoccales archaeon Mx-06]